MVRPDWTTVARLNEVRLCAIARDLAEEAVELREGEMTYARGVPWLSRASGLGVSGFGAEPGVGPPPADAVKPYAADVARIVEFYTARGAVPKAEICSLAPEPLLAALAGAGFTTMHYENVLAADLAEPGPRPEHAAPTAMEIVRTDPGDPEMLRAHAMLATRWFVPAGEELTEDLLAMTAKAVAHPRSIGFMAMIGSEGVGACGMETHDLEGQRLAVLWGGSVEPAYRRRGIQLAMLARRLAVAREMGCRVAIIESKPGIATERNAARVGFQLVCLRAIMQRGPGEGDGLADSRAAQ